ncbi:mercury resistance system transport protein MerF [Halobacillus locisalis]|uniref:Mercury resistance system transport protein MerF n=1 Tax=Halobacillus locisalis TaxID=220753 RepID=A0A838CVX7_9BACI|nr:mercury resistance system transport protein MerF [Halobacillus locisalis]MBA2176071.1 mercury resistance system transport protein MerF [Halobacillus locisalis]
MRRNKWFVGSVVGFIITLLCCATPLLVIMLGVLGLGAWTGYLDYVLFPMLIIFLILAVVTYKKRCQTSTDKDCCS